MNFDKTVKCECGEIFPYILSEDIQDFCAHLRACLKANSTLVYKVGDKFVPCSDIHRKYGNN